MRQLRFTSLCALFRHLLASVLVLTLIASADAAARRNVLFITADDLRPWLAAYGHPLAQTPHLDRLAASGVRFERAYVQQAWCAPSRTSVLTGLRPDTTRVYDLETHFRANVPDVVTLPQHFRRHGYATAAFGKVYHESMDDAPSWSNPRSDLSLPGGTFGGTFFYGTAENVAAAAQNRARPGYAAPTEKGPDDPNLYPDERITTAAIEFLRTREHTPFFLAVGFYKPHLPFTAPTRHWDRYRREDLKVTGPLTPPAGAPASAFLARAEHHNYTGLAGYVDKPVPPDTAAELIHGYLACISFIDEQVGRLLDALDELKLADNTIVVFWGDHGFKLGEYGQWSKNSNLEIDTRVPLLVAGPGVQRGVRTEALTETLDLYPTLAELTALPAPRGVEGRSFAALLRGERTDHKRAAFSQIIRNAERTYTTYARAMEMGQAVRTDRYRFVRWWRRSEPARPFAFELYDHTRDPGETVNVADQPRYTAAIEELNALLDRTMPTPFPR